MRQPISILGGTHFPTLILKEVAILEKTVAVSLRGITKQFGRITANKNVDLDIYKGEILSLLGENGSGKTTLMNMLSGIYHQDSGQIYVDGKEVVINSPHDAYELGIGMIHQHFKLIDIFSSIENIVLGLDRSKKFDLKAARDEVLAICSRYGFQLDPDKKVYNMSVSEKQTLEIVKVLYRGADILILDEPTAVLTPQESEKLFEVIRNMKADGKSIIIITHKLQEVLSVSDRVAILRKGEYIGETVTSEATELSLTEMMVGKKVSLDIERPEPENVTDRVKISHLTCLDAQGNTTLEDVTLDIRSGEILGIAGIAGCGQKELLEAVAGLQITSPGSSIIYNSPDDEKSRQLIGLDPRTIREMGVALSFVPEDRLGMGLVASMGMTGNMMLKKYKNGPTIFTEKKAPKELAEKIKNDLGVITPDINTPVRQLSGGNVQKVLVGREIAASPTVLMTAYAVRGLDINTSYMIYHMLNEEKKKGTAVVFVGEDLDVLLALSDRILVLCGGKVSGLVDARSVTKEELGLMMTTLPDEKKIGEEASAE